MEADGGDAYDKETGGNESELGLISGSWVLDEHPEPFSRGIDDE